MYIAPGTYNPKELPKGYHKPTVDEHGNATTASPTKAHATSSPTNNASSPAAVPKRRRAVGAGGVGRSLLGTRGGAGIQLNSPTRLKAPDSTSLTMPTTIIAHPSRTVLNAASAPVLGVRTQPTFVTTASHIRPPGPAYYDQSKSISVAEQRSFHLNSSKRWM